MRSRMTLAGVSLTCLFLVGCQHRWQPDPEFGVAVRNLAAAQYLNPVAPVGVSGPGGLDGVAAQSSVEAYQQSFKAPTSEDLGTVTQQ